MDLKMFSNQIAPVNVETLKIQKGSRREERVLPPKEAWYTICCTWSWTFLSLHIHTYTCMGGGQFNFPSTLLSSSG